MEKIRHLQEEDYKKHFDSKKSDDVTFEDLMGSQDSDGEVNEPEKEDFVCARGSYEENR